jgi:uncharacterized damage-inducible protein DinB
VNPILTELFRHNLWANLGIVDCCLAVPESVLEASVPGTFGSIRNTLTHIAGAEGRYLAVLTGGPEQRNPTLEEAAPDLATEHRTHIKTALTQSGVEPPDIDGWHWARRDDNP